MNRKLIFTVLIALILTVAAAACAAKVDEEVISFADGAAENILIAINDKDHESFNQNMDDVMKGIFTEQEFTELYDYINNNIGEYRQGSKKYLSSTIQSGLNVVDYTADYTEETESVIVSIVISKSGEGTYEISGLWFNSPKLRDAE